MSSSLSKSSRESSTVGEAATGQEKLASEYEEFMKMVTDNTVSPASSGNAKKPQEKDESPLPSDHESQGEADETLKKHHKSKKKSKSSKKSKDQLETVKVIKDAKSEGKSTVQAAKSESSVDEESENDVSESSIPADWENVKIKVEKSSDDNSGVAKKKKKKKEKKRRKKKASSSDESSLSSAESEDAEKSVKKKKKKKRKKAATSSSESDSEDESSSSESSSSDESHKKKRKKKKKLNKKSKKKHRSKSKRRKRKHSTGSSGSDVKKKKRKRKRSSSHKDSEQSDNQTIEEGKAKQKTKKLRKPELSESAEVEVNDSTKELATKPVEDQLPVPETEETWDKAPIPSDTPKVLEIATNFPLSKEVVVPELPIEPEVVDAKPEEDKQLMEDLEKIRTAQQKVSEMEKILQENPAIEKLLQDGMAMKRDRLIKEEEASATAIEVATPGSLEDTTVKSQSSESRSYVDDWEKSKEKLAKKRRWVDADLDSFNVPSLTQLERESGESLDQWEVDSLDSPHSYSLAKNKLGLTKLEVGKGYSGKDAYASESSKDSVKEDKTTVDSETVVKKQNFHSAVVTKKTRWSVVENVDGAPVNWEEESDNWSVHVKSTENLAIKDEKLSVKVLAKSRKGDLYSPNSPAVSVASEDLEKSNDSNVNKKRRLEGEFKATMSPVQLPLSVDKLPGKLSILASESIKIEMDSEKSLPGDFKLVKPRAIVSDNEERKVDDNAALKLVTSQLLAEDKSKLENESENSMDCLPKPVVLVLNLQKRLKQTTLFDDDPDEEESSTKSERSGDKSEQMGKDKRGNYRSKERSRTRSHSRERRRRSPGIRRDSPERGRRNSRDRKDYRKFGGYNDAGSRSPSRKRRRSRSRSNSWERDSNVNNSRSWSRSRSKSPKRRDRRSGGPRSFRPNDRRDRTRSPRQISSKGTFLYYINNFLNLFFIHSRE